MDPGTGHAHVLAAVADEPSYRAFMRTRHDAVSAGRFDTFTSVEAVTGEVITAMHGRCHCRRRPAAARSCGWPAAAWCPGTRSISSSSSGGCGRPGRAAAAGMFAALGSGRCLVATLWSEPAAHRRYAIEDVLGLRERPGAEADLVDLAGYVLPLEPRWRVVGDRPRGRPRNVCS